MPDPFTYFYDSINRNAIVIKPKQALFDWVNSIYPEDPVEFISEGTVYLIKEKDSNIAIENWLKRNFDQIFANELNNWHTDENDWPQKRTYSQFKAWFDVEIHSMILDLEEGEVWKE
jgi:hypothetical protein